MFILTSPVNFQNVFSDFWLKAVTTNRHSKGDARAPLSDRDITHRSPTFNEYCIAQRTAGAIAFSLLYIYN